MARFLRQSPLTIIVLAFLILLGGFIFWNLAAPEQDARVLAIRQRGYPVSLAELDAWYTHIPESQNAATALTTAFSQPGLKDSSSTMTVIGDKSWVPARGHRLDDEAKAELGAVLATNQALLDQLYSAAELTNCRYPVDLTQGFNTLLPHLAKLKGSVQLLTAEALLDVSNGDIEKALAALRTASAVANSVANEPLLISQLVRIAGWAIISKRTELILNGVTLSDEQLSALQSLFRDAEQPNAMARALAGERASGLGLFMGGQDQLNIFGGSGSSPPPPKNRLQASLFIGVYKSTGLLHKDKAFYLDTMAKYISTAEAPFPETFAITLPANGAALTPGKMMIFSRMLLPALSRTLQRDGEHAARIRTTQTAIAIERYRRVHGNNLPNELNELVPTCLGALPQDPFDGQLLRFKRLASGYVVYSIGSDLHDDGGSEGDPKKPGSAKDITFTLER
jgi:hypothetical protein